MRGQRTVKREWEGQVRLYEGGGEDSQHRSGINRSHGGGGRNDQCQG